MAHFKLKDQALSVGDPKPVKQEKKKPVPIKKKFKASPHKKVYLDFFGFKDESEVFCEIPHCGKLAVDINHIDCRGMGGTTHIYTIEELMGMCRKHHDEYGDKKQWKEFLRLVHEKFIKRFKD